MDCPSSDQIESFIVDLKKELSLLHRPMRTVQLIRLQNPQVHYVSTAAVLITPMYRYRMSDICIYIPETQTMLSLMLNFYLKKKSLHIYDISWRFHTTAGDLEEFTKLRDLGHTSLIIDDMYDVHKRLKNLFGSIDAIYWSLTTYLQTFLRTILKDDLKLSSLSFISEYPRGNLHGYYRDEYSRNRVDGVESEMKVNTTEHIRMLMPEEMLQKRRGGCILL